MFKENLDAERVMGENAADEQVGESLVNLPDADRVVDAELEAGLPIQISAWGGQGTKSKGLLWDSRQDYLKLV